MALEGVHHITAITADAPRNVDYYARLLGLRLVKKTVNFDNHHVYHFYYGDADGTPGTLWTTFPYKGRGVGVGHKGAGQVTVTSFSVPNGSLDVWRQRLGALDQRQRFLVERIGSGALHDAARHHAPLPVEAERKLGLAEPAARLGRIALVALELGDEQPLQSHR